MRLLAVCLILTSGCRHRDGAPADAAAPADAEVDAPTGPAVDAEAPLDAPAEPPPPLPTIPIGMEAFRQWDRLPALRIGMRTVMRSTFDRNGGNEGADASHFIRQAADGNFVALDLEGPGVLAFVRTNHWHGSPWHYVVDGRDTVVSETTTADPLHPAADSTFLPEALFPAPLAQTWSATRGADLSWVPIPFERSFELRYGRTHYGTGYYIIHRFAEGSAHTVPPLRSWDARTPPDPDVVALVARSGEDMTPAGATAGDGAVSLAAGDAAVLPDLQGPAVIRALELEAPRAQADALAGARLRITWDGRAEASVDAPLPLFFGAGTLFNRDERPFLVRAFLSHVRFDRDAAGGERINLATYFPMPFSSSARIEIVAGAVPLDLTWRLRTVPATEPAEAVGYFHATFRDHQSGVAAQDLVILDTEGAEGSGAWCGTFAGMSWTFSDRGVLTTLEGDPRFFFDDSASPQAQGTGTEEWGGGGDYWGGQTMTLPFAGHPVGAPGPKEARGPEDLIESAYRFLVVDAMPFGRRARIQMEHGGSNESPERYRSVAYWYGHPGACLVRTDELHVGDAADEAHHQYLSPQASPVETLSSQYELGVAAAASSDSGRHTTGSTELRLAIDPRNVGVLLRRKLDLRFPDQRALVEVAGDDPGAPFVAAGVWSTAGSDVVLYSNPPGELDEAAPVVQTSNRRWREDEFLLPRALTEGRGAIRVRLTFLPRNLPLRPGLPVAPQAWSEVRYWVYSWRFPPVE
jgi:D-arabinan exo alpha-(1,3)/(1,5)-arabinofuranosidase (non-reducing end)